MAEASLPEKGAGKPDAPTFGRALGPGMGVNLLVTDIECSLRFLVPVLGMDVAYWDDDFAIVTAGGSTWMLHHDRTYHANPLGGVVKAAEARGVGIELHVYGRDPDLSEGLAEAAGGTIMAGAADKPHGLREACLLDPDGYLWVPSISSA